MCPKRGRVEKCSPSRATPTPSAPTFPNLKFLSEANVGKYLKFMDYHIMREISFACKDLRGFKEVVEMLQQRQWVCFNDLIQKTNKTIGLKFYENDDFSDVGSYTSYVQGKYIDYSASVINSILNLQPPPVCALMTYRNEHHVINKTMTQEMLDALCRPGAKWLIKCGLAMRLRTTEILQTPRAYASFFVQTLEAASSHSHIYCEAVLRTFGSFKWRAY